MIDDKDKQIIETLRKNSRTKLKEIAKNAAMPLSSTHDRLKALMEKKLVKPVTIVREDKIGFGLRSWLFIKTKNKKQVMEILERSPYVNRIITVHNGADIMAECFFKNFKQNYELVEKLKENCKVTESQVIEAIKVEGADL